MKMGAEISPAAADGFALREIGQIAIAVRDLDAAADFYERKLSMRRLLEAPGMVFFDLGSVRLMLALPEAPELDHPASIIYYRVADIDRAARILGDRGVVFEHKPRLVHPGEAHDLWLASLRDPDGNILALMEEKPKTARAAD